MQALDGGEASGWHAYRIGRDQPRKAIEGLNYAVMREERLLIDGPDLLGSCQREGNRRNGVPTSPQFHNVAVCKSLWPQLGNNRRMLLGLAPFTEKAGIGEAQRPRDICLKQPVPALRIW